MDHRHAGDGNTKADMEAPAEISLAGSLGLGSTRRIELVGRTPAKVIPV